MRLAIVDEKVLRSVALPEVKLARPTVAWVIFGAFVIATLMRGTGVFLYDANKYWTAAQSLVGSAPAATTGYWDVRGVLTGFIYLPAAVLTAVTDPRFAGFAVLVQNSLVLACFAAFLLPWMVGRWRPLSSRAQWVGAFLAWIVLSGFAPYPLTDLYPAIACFAVVLLLRFQRRGTLLVGGVLAGAAMNVRPAYLVTIVLVALIAIVWRRWSGLLFPVGIAIGLLPQLIFNLVKHGMWSLLPPSSAGLVALQAGYASYIVRYDTLLGAAVPRQFYCSPAMADNLGSALPQTAGQLVSVFLTKLPDSLVFSLEKIGAAVQWPFSNPYTVPMPGLDFIFGLFVSAITIIGIVALIRLAVRNTRRRAFASWYEWALIAAIVVGGILTLISSATETRFALPLVLIGIAGCTTLVDLSPRAAWSRGHWWIIGAVVLTTAVVFAGYAGVSHPAPAGKVTASICASL